MPLAGNVIVAMQKVTQIELREFFDAVETSPNSGKYKKGKENRGSYFTLIGSNGLMPKKEEHGGIRARIISAEAHALASDLATKNGLTLANIAWPIMGTSGDIYVAHTWQ